MPSQRRRVWAHEPACGVSVRVFDLPFGPARSATARGPSLIRRWLSSSEEALQEIRRLLLAEEAMRSVAAWAQFHIDNSSAMPSDWRARLVATAGVAVMFCRPFVRDNKRMSLDPDSFRLRLADGAKQLMFDRLRLRRSKVLAHADTDAGVINVTETYKMFARRDPDDPLDLRAYNVGADHGILGPEDLAVIADLAKTLADLFSSDMVALGAQRVRELA